MSLTLLMMIKIITITNKLQ